MLPKMVWNCGYFGLNLEKWIFWVSARVASDVSRPESHPTHHHPLQHPNLAPVQHSHPKWHPAPGWPAQKRLMRYPQTRDQPNTFKIKSTVHVFLEPSSYFLHVCVTDVWLYWNHCFKVVKPPGASPGMSWKGEELIWPKTLGNQNWPLDSQYNLTKSFVALRACFTLSFAPFGTMYDAC